MSLFSRCGVRPAAGPRRWIAGRRLGLAALLAVLPACIFVDWSTEPPPSSITVLPDASAPASTESPAVADTRSEAAPSSTSAPSNTAAVTTAPSEQLPGEPFDLAEEGTRLAVIGVRFDDVLTLRGRPGADQLVLAGLAPHADDLTATGRSRALTRSFWLEVVAGDGKVGWVSAKYIGVLGRTLDSTSAVTEALGGAPPSAPDMAGLGMTAARAMASEEPPSEIVMSGPPAEGETGEVVFDVVGLGDDSVLGMRLRVFGVRGADGGYTLERVEETVVCYPRRGATPEGLCR